MMASPCDDALRRDKDRRPSVSLWADSLGLLVWEEMPSAYRFTPKSINRLLREWTEVIYRDYSHPCVVVWVPFNESWGVPDLPATAAHRDAVQAFYYLTKSLDPTRWVVGNDGWESTATDIVGIHDYDSDPARLRERYGPSVKVEELFDRRRPGGRILTLDGYPHRGQPIMLTEFGGIAYVWPGNREAAKAWGYMRTDELAEFEAKFRALVEVVRTTAMFSGFCYTQFADTFQEANGLLYADRTPKLPLEVIAAATGGES